MDKQAKIDSFLAELKQLCEKHEISICKGYDEPVYLYDKDLERLSEDVEFDEYKADVYVEPVYKPIDTNFKPVTYTEANAAFKEFYAKPMKEFAESPSYFEKYFKLDK